MARADDIAGITKDIEHALAATRAERPKGKAGLLDMLGVMLGALAGRTSKDIAALRERVERLEANRLEYEGTFEAGKTYRRGSAITHDGSLWIAMQATADAPPSPAWRLAVRKGRDAR